MDQVLESQKQKQWFFDSIVALSDGLRRARITLYSVDPLGTADALSLRTDYKQFLKGVKKAGQADLGDLALQYWRLRVEARCSIPVTIWRRDRNLRGGHEWLLRSLLRRPSRDGPNEYHALDVKLDKPGLTARTRAGYYAQPER